MKHLVRFSLVALLLVLGPSALADLEPARDWAPSDPCGSIDPDRACYVTSGSTTCPENKSYDSCIERCHCVYTKNDKACGSNAYCKQVVLAELRACKTNCGVDWAFLRQPIDDSHAPAVWAGHGAAALTQG